MPGKYSPLEEYLRELPVTQKEATMTFELIEGILGSALPASAHEDDRWWKHATEGNHRNTRAWANAGWKVERVDVTTRRVRFVRE